MPRLLILAEQTSAINFRLGYQLSEQLIANAAKHRIVISVLPPSFSIG